MTVSSRMVQLLLLFKVKAMKCHIEIDKQLERERETNKMILPNFQTNTEFILFDICLNEEEKIKLTKKRKKKQCLLKKVIKA